MCSVRLFTPAILTGSVDSNWIVGATLEKKLLHRCPWLASGPTDHRKNRSSSGGLRHWLNPEGLPSSPFLPSDPLPSPCHGGDLAPTSLPSLPSSGVRGLRKEGTHHAAEGGFSEGQARQDVEDKGPRAQ